MLTTNTRGATFAAGDQSNPTSERTFTAGLAVVAVCPVEVVRGKNRTLPVEPEANRRSARRFWFALTTCVDAPVDAMYDQMPGSCIYRAAMTQRVAVVPAEESADSPTGRVTVMSNGKAVETL